MSRLKRVVIESPYAGDIHANTQYAIKCLRDSLKLGESPIASHILYAHSGALCEVVDDDRLLGVEAGYAWMEVCDHVAAYVDLGISDGMKTAIRHAVEIGKPVEYRWIK